MNLTLASHTRRRRDAMKYVQVGWVVQLKDGRVVAAEINKTRSEFRKWFCLVRGCKWGDFKTNGNIVRLYVEVKK